MRTDCKIDNRAIPCPNASLLGYAYGRAKAGHCVTYREGDKVRLARVLGRVTAPALPGDASPVKGWALVMALSEDGTHAYERWINPANITRVFDAPTNLAAFFFAPTLPYGVATMRRLMEHGTICDSYVAEAPDRVAMFAERDANAY